MIRTTSRCPATHLTALAAAAVVTTTSLAVAAAADEPPSTLISVPAVRTMTPSPVSWTASGDTRIVVTDPTLSGDADTLAAELGNAFGTHKLAVVTDRPTAGDLVVATGDVPGTTSREAYRIEATAGALVITGRSPAGTWLGTRTVLQALADRSGGRTGTYSGTVVDEPAYAERSLMIDVGRKYYTPDWMKERIRELSYLKLNTLHLHLSEAQGFRITSAVAPDIVSPQHWTDAELASILAEARRYHITVIPEIDTPGHMENLLRQRPEFQLTLADGTKQPGKLDISNPKARAFVKSLIAESIEKFPGLTAYHIGGDEYLPAPWESQHLINDRNAPQLVRWVQAETGKTNLTVADAYAHYMNELADFVRAKGLTARMWNDDVYPAIAVPVTPETQVDQWIRWNTRKPNTSDYIAGGHQVVNSNGDYLYMILTRDGIASSEKKSAQGIYELWTPRTFMGTAGGGADYVLPDMQPMLGAHLSVWADAPDVATEAEVRDALSPRLRAFAQQMWGTAKLAPTFERFEADVSAMIGGPPIPRADDRPTPTVTPTASPTPTVAPTASVTPTPTSSATQTPRPPAPPTPLPPLRPPGTGSN